MPEGSARTIANRADSSSEHPKAGSAAPLRRRLSLHMQSSCGCMPIESGPACQIGPGHGQQPRAWQPLRRVCHAPHFGGAADLGSPAEAVPAEPLQESAAEPAEPDIVG